MPGPGLATSGKPAMSPPPTGDRGRASPSRIEPRSSIELAAAVDDRRDPSTVTLYPKHGRNRTTAWMSIGVDWVLSLDEMV